MNVVLGLIKKSIGDLAAGTIALVQIDRKLVHGFTFTYDRGELSVLVLEGPRAGETMYPDSDVAFVSPTEASMHPSIDPSDLAMECPETKLPLYITPSGATYFVVTQHGNRYGIALENGVFGPVRAHNALFVSKWEVRVDGEEIARLRSPSN